jgi:DNA-binding beta-propeller fold protein YncE
VRFSRGEKKEGTRMASQWRYSILLFLFLVSVSISDMARATPIFQSAIDTSSFGASHPEGITFDAETGNLWILDEGGVYEVTTTGNVASTFSHGFYDYADGITIDPLTKNLLITTIRSPDYDGGIYQFTLAGAMVGTSPLMSITPAATHPYGIAVEPTSANVWIADEYRNAISQFDRNGNQIDSFAYHGFDDPEGLAFDPLTGTLFVADDDAKMIFEFTTTGDLIQAFSTVPFGVYDPEGVAYDATTGSLYILGDNDRKVVQLSTGREVMANPIPATGWLFGLGLIGLTAIRRKYKKRSSPKKQMG